MRLSDSTKAGGHAVVVGGSVAGLLAARALSPRFAHVTLVESDVLPEGAAHRRGTPQSPHHHVMLAAGRRVLEELFPGLDADLDAEGTELVDWGWDCLVHSSAGEVPRFRSDLVTRPCTRPLLEWHIRRRVLALPNITLVEGRKVDRLIVGDGSATGVALDTGGEELSADLVVDASGRRSKAPQWLEAAGYRPPELQVVDASLGYATRMYRRPDEANDRWKAILVASRHPDNPRAAGLSPQEGGRWLVTLAGTAGHHPPIDEAGFLAFAKRLASPVIHDAIRRAEPLGPIQAFRRTANEWRRYDKLARMPERLVIVGDAACAFNPIYGQGMTVAAMQATHLARCLDAGPPRELAGLSRRYHRGLPALIEPAWLLATGEDLRWSSAGARAGALARMSHWYIDQLMALTGELPLAARAFLSVMHMVEPPIAMFHPAVAARVLARALLPRTATAAPAKAGA